MQSIQPNQQQTIFDIALEQYGTLEALPFLVMDNPNQRLDEAPLGRIIIREQDSKDIIQDTLTKRALSKIKIVSL
jgi:hypothetical protein